MQDLLRAEGMAQAFEGYQDATLPMDVSAVEALIYWKNMEPFSLHLDFQFLLFCEMFNA